jgi:hypothetical protein
MKSAMKQKSTYLLFFISITLFNCEPEMPLLRTFLIKKGEHYSKARMPETLQDSKMVFEAKFDNTAKYDLGDLASQSSKNKLLGFSDCNSLHHENSARFGWQWYNNRLEIFAYCYTNGERIEKFIGVVGLNEFNTYEIDITDANYVFRVNNEQPVLIARGDVCKSGIFYILWPYFGGELPAPHDIFIEVKQHH